MITEAQQEQASLYALDSLGAAEKAAFELELSTNSELRELAAELRELAASLAFGVPQKDPPTFLKSRLLTEIRGGPGKVAGKNVLPFPEWIPWAIAAGLALCCGLLAYDRLQLERRAESAQRAQRSEHAKLVERSEKVERQILVALRPAPGGPADAEALIAWQPEKQAGFIKIKNLPRAAAGRDYQLWAIDSEHKEPVSAGVVRTNSNGSTAIEFRSTKAAGKIKAFAISLEREGGSPKKEGPILLLGTA